VKQQVQQCGMARALAGGLYLRWHGEACLLWLGLQEYAVRGAVGALLQMQQVAHIRSGTVSNMAFLTLADLWCAVVCCCIQSADSCPCCVRCMSRCHLLV
jgi:hypothetical protein